MRMSIFTVVTKLALFVLWLMAVCAPPYLIRRWLQSRRPSTIPRPLIVDGANRIVPVLATFGGLRGLTWIGVSRNNLSPRLVIEPDGISFKVLRSQSRRYEQIEQIDLRMFGATINIRFLFRGEATTFDANVGNLALAAEVLKLLTPHVALSERARDFVDRQDVKNQEGSHKLVSATDDQVAPAETMERHFRFQPRWKEELVVIAQEGSFVLVLAMGIPTAYLPLPAEWQQQAPEWARPLWATLRDELEEWCHDNDTEFVIGDP
jgi:hypothetical protein